MFLPFSGSKDDVKSAVFRVLSSELPLSARQIYSKIKRDYALEVSYQAVHKVLVSLRGEGVLSFSDKKYSLSLSWLDSLENFSKEARRMLSGDILSDLPSVLEFNSVTEVDSFLVDISEKLGGFLPKDEMKIFMQWCHFWIPLFLDKEIYSKIKSILDKVESYAITSANTPVDKWCTAFWRPTLKNIKCGVQSSSNVSDFIIIGNYVVQVFYPLDIKKEMDSIFSKAKKVEDIDWDEFYKKVFEKETKIPVAILKNKSVAEELKKQTALAFRK